MPRRARACLVCGDVYYGQGRCANYPRCPRATYRQRQGFIYRSMRFLSRRHGEHLPQSANPCEAAHHVDTVVRVAANEISGRLSGQRNAGPLKGFTRGHYRAAPAKPVVARSASRPAVTCPGPGGMARSGKRPSSTPCATSAPPPPCDETGHRVAMLVFYQ